MGMSTQNMMKLLNSAKSIDTLLEQNSGNFVSHPLCDALAALLAQKGLTRSQAIKNSMLNTIYGQQIFAGRKTPSRDKLITIIFGLGLTFDEAETLLKEQGYPRLYPRNQRDAIIIYSLVHGCSLLDTNTKLYENELPTLL